jgi:hypothetical protein
LWLCVPSIHIRLCFLTSGALIRDMHGSWSEKGTQPVLNCSYGRRATENVILLASCSCFHGSYGLVLLVQQDRIFYISLSVHSGFQTHQFVKQKFTHTWRKPGRSRRSFQ